MARLSDTELVLWRLREEIRLRDEALGRVRELADFFGGKNTTLGEAILAAIEGAAPKNKKRAESWKVYRCCGQQVPDGHLRGCKGARND